MSITSKYLTLCATINYCSKDLFKSVLATDNKASIAVHLIGGETDIKNMSVRISVCFNSFDPGTVHHSDCFVTDIEEVDNGEIDVAGLCRSFEDQFTTLFNNRYWVPDGQVQKE